jgi:hypothetical protein
MMAGKFRAAAHETEKRAFSLRKSECVLPFHTRRIERASRKTRGAAKRRETRIVLATPSLVRRPQAEERHAVERALDRLRGRFSIFFILSVAPH